jgi:hypothetical protein
MHLYRPFTHTKQATLQIPSLCVVYAAHPNMALDWRYGVRISIWPDEDDAVKRAIKGVRFRVVRQVTMKHAVPSTDI